MNYRTLLLTVLTGVLYLNSSGQTCPTSGTITADCSYTGNMIINGSTLNVNSGVTVTVTGNLMVQADGTLNGTGATFNISGDLQDGWGTLNTVNGGAYNIGGNFSSGSGGSFSLSDATLTFSPGGTYSFNNGGDNVISNCTITGVTSWYTNIGTASGSNYGVTVTNSNITVADSASWHNANTTNTTINIGGNVALSSGTSTFTNSTFNVGTNNPGTTGENALTFNGGAILELYNDSQMNVRGDVINNDWYVDDSDVVITGDFNNAGAEILEVRNNGTFVVNGDFNNTEGGNVSADDGGVVQVDGDYDNTNGNTDADNGAIVVGGTFSGAEPTGDASGCDPSASCCGSCGALPVALVSFVIEDNNAHAELGWETATETNNDIFIIEKSVDGKDFQKVAEVNGSGNSFIPIKYSWLDTNANDVVTYYRLSQIDFDGTTDILGIEIHVPMADLKRVSIFPNPLCAGQKLQIDGFEPLDIQILDLSGTVIRHYNADTIIQLSNDLAPGNYILVLAGGSIRLTKMLIIQ